MISLVVIGRNEAQNLKRCFESINREQFKKVIYVDSSSGEVCRPSTKLTSLEGISDKVIKKICTSAYLKDELRYLDEKIIE